MKNIRLGTVLLVGICLAVFNVSAVKATSETTQLEANSDNPFQLAYDEGRSKGIITDKNMSYSEFIGLCKNSVFPAYLNYIKDNPTISFSEYISDDNYEVPQEQLSDNPTEISASDHHEQTASAMTGKNRLAQVMTKSISADSGYDMKAGDILVCYGTNSISNFPGHAAIATSSKYVLEMPGPFGYSSNKNAHHHSKKFFFTHHTGKDAYVIVYRIKNHPNYADDASTYAYTHMFISDNPSYLITTNLYHKSPSYCSKYVYLAYYWGATKNSVYYHKYNTYIVTPHSLVPEFRANFAPSAIHKVTKY